jgi:hypothetical protein
MVVKSLGSAGDDVPPVEPYLSCGANPFNPAIAISFGLDRRDPAQSTKKQPFQAADSNWRPLRGSNPCCRRERAVS